ncbi:MAG: hypothetical protein QNJ34_19335 [Xenococcaceae cyanobacterium MO_188.B29]|nr:hypothetical protein [Xenococcaceae cyanobacterium MO_188.B29]
MSGKKKLPNGIVPDDGTYLGAKKGKALREAKIREQFDLAWKSQKTLLRNSLVKLYKDKASLGLQWSTMLDWDDSLLPSPRRIKRGLNALNITVKDAVEAFTNDYWLNKDKNRYQDHINLKKTYLRFYKRIPDWNVTPTKEVLNKVAREYPKSVNRNKCCTALKKLAPYCGLLDYDPQEFRLRKNQIEVKAKPKRDLTEQEIEEWYNKFPQWQGKKGNPSHWELWQWWYGMQATYGFRNHEVLNIYNLDCQYIDDKGKVYEPFIDPAANPRGIIYTRGKGVKRAAFLPQPIKWLEQFSLRKIPKEYYNFVNEIQNLTEYKKEKAKDSKGNSYRVFLYDHKYPFTAYNLRHAYNVKSHGLGIPVSLIAKNLGHTIQQNTTTYLESQGVKSCLDALDAWEKRQQNKADNDLSLESQIDLLRQENEQLKAIIQQLLESLKANN